MLLIKWCMFPKQLNCKPFFDEIIYCFRLKIYGMLGSMVIFLRQEIDRMQRVINLVRSTLKDLLLAIDGTIIMNEVLS